MKTDAETTEPQEFPWMMRALLVLVNACQRPVVVIMDQ